VFDVPEQIPVFSEHVVPQFVMEILRTVYQPEPLNIDGQINVILCFIVFMIIIHEH
jgi:hypothetical protein